MALRSEGRFHGSKVRGQVRSRSRSVCNVHNAGHAREKFAGNFGKKVGSGVRVIFEEIFANLSVRVSKNLRDETRCYGKRWV